VFAVVFPNVDFLLRVIKYLLANRNFMLVIRHPINISDKEISSAMGVEEACISKIIIIIIIKI
jgi:hypothetical protein